MEQQIILAPGNLPVLSKENTAAFYQQLRTRILETGEGLFEFVELVKFFEGLAKHLNGDKVAKIEPDKEMLDYIREQIRHNSDDPKSEKASFKTMRGVKFELAETGTAYDYTKCNDPVWAQLESQSKEIKEKLTERQKFLQTIPEQGMEIRHEDELITIFRPSKSSKSSFKVTLPK